MPNVDQIMVAEGSDVSPGTEDVKLENVSHEGGGGGFDPSSLDVSTNVPADADEIVTGESGTWYRKAFSKVWNYIKTKIGISSQGDAGKYLNEQGEFTTPPSGPTYSIVSTTEDGLAPKVTDTNKFLKGDGTWDMPPIGPTYDVFSLTQNGLVPKSGGSSKNPNHYLFDDGTWGWAENQRIDFTSGDSSDSDASSWTSLSKITSNTLGNLMNTISSMMKNTRYLYKQMTPIGSISAYGGTSAPSGWLLCQGQAVSRTTYSALFSVIGTNFGAGNGSTTFNIPDLRGEFLRGAGTNAHSGCGNGGSVGTHQNPTNIPHAQLWTNGTTVVSVANADANKAVPALSNIDTGLTATAYYCDLASGSWVSRSGNQGTYTTRPTNTSVNYIIKAT